MENTPQTLEGVLFELARQWQTMGIIMLMITLVSLLIGYLLLKSNQPVWLHRFMSAPIFLTTLPGMFFVMIIAYLFLFTRQNLLTMPLFFFFPPVWMAASLYLFRQLVDFNQVPGFDRLGGLALFAAITFAAAFILARLQIIAIVWIRPVWLIPIAILFYLGWRLAWKKLLRK